MRGACGYEGSSPTPAGRPGKGRSERPRAHPRDGKRVVLPRGHPRHRRRYGRRAIRRVKDEPLSPVESKDALIAAFAAERDRSFWAWWDHIEEQHADDPRVLLEALLARIA